MKIKQILLNLSIEQIAVLVTSGVIAAAFAYTILPTTSDSSTQDKPNITKDVSRGGSGGQATDNDPAKTNENGSSSIDSTSPENITKTTNQSDPLNTNTTNNLGDSQESNSTSNSGTNSNSDTIAGPASGSNTNPLPDPDPSPNPDPDPPANQPPTAPNILSAVHTSGNTVLIRITPATDSDGSVVSHTLYRNGLFFNTTSDSSNPIFVYDNTVVAGGSYSYVALATDNDSAQSPNSNTATVNVPSDITPPSTPTNFRLTAAYDTGSCRLTLAWDPSTDNAVTQGDLWYIITSPADESYFYTWTQNNPYSPLFCWDTGTHEIYIQATDGDNDSAKAGPVTITVP